MIGASRSAGSGSGWWQAAILELWLAIMPRKKDKVNRFLNAACKGHILSFGFNSPAVFLNRKGEVH